MAFELLLARQQQVVIIIEPTFSAMQLAIRRAMEFGHILFAIDFSDHSQALNSDVEWLASRFGSRVTLMHVFEIPSIWSGTGEMPLISPDHLRTFAESEEQRLHDYALNLPEARIQRIAAEGAPAWHIANWVNNNDVDLVMIGARGLGKFRPLLMGSVAAKVIHDVTCPVWTDSIRSSATRQPEYRNLVCAIDLTEEAVMVLQFADGLARELGANVHLVHCVPEAETRPDKYFDFDVYSYLVDSARVAISKLQRRAGTELPVDIKASAIPAAVSDVVSEQKANLLIIGRGQVEQSMGCLRTHAYQIIRDATCPVLSCSLESKRQSPSPCKL